MVVYDGAMKQLEIYTDGGASPNPGKGGWGVVILENGEKVKELFGGESESSNNRMELVAAIEGLLAVGEEDLVVVHTDSNYVKQGINLWIKGWKANGWKTAAKKPVKNQDLWRKLDDVVSRRKVRWEWVAGHSGNEWNEYVDGLVWKARESLEG